MENYHLQWNNCHRKKIDYNSPLREFFSEFIFLFGQFHSNEASSAIGEAHTQGPTQPHQGSNANPRGGNILVAINPNLNRKKLDPKVLQPSSIRRFQKKHNILPERLCTKSISKSLIFRETFLLPIFPPNPIKQGKVEDFQQKFHSAGPYEPPPQIPYKKPTPGDAEDYSDDIWDMKHVFEAQTDQIISEAFIVATDYDVGHASPRGQPGLVAYVFGESDS